MKPLRLTDLAQQTSLTDGSCQTFAVFNEGELRVPISDEAAQMIIRFSFADQVEQPSEGEQAADDQQFSVYAIPKGSDEIEDEEDDGSVQG